MWIQELGMESPVPQSLPLNTLDSPVQHLHSCESKGVKRDCEEPGLYSIPILYPILTLDLIPTLKSLQRRENT